jgi:hypothetical protein
MYRSSTVTKIVIVSKARKTIFAVYIIACTVSLTDFFFPSPWEELMGLPH